MLSRRLSLLLVVALLGFASTAAAEAKKKLLLIGQGPDGHPRETHEYYAGLRVLEETLAPLADQLEIQQIRADGDWHEGPDLLAKADGVVLYLAEGAKWVEADARRYQAFVKLAERGGGLVALHWAIGARDAKHVAGYQKLLGAVHGGADRKYKFLETAVTVADRDHPITRGIADFRIKDEFYYQLKFTDAPGIVPLLKAEIDDERYTVCWAWERPDKGRSFGFSAMHYHDNWRRPEYRRLVGQGVLWTLRLDAPAENWPPPLADEVYQLPPAADKKKGK